MSESNTTKITEKAKRYIVTHNILAEHATWADAEAERQRLKEKYKHNNLHVYCVLEKFQNYEDINLKDGKLIHEKI